MEIVSLSEDEIKKNDRNVSAILDLEDLKSLKELLDYFKENKLDLTTVYLKGIYDGKEQATADLTITKEKLAEDTLKENIKLKKELEKLKIRNAFSFKYFIIDYSIFLERYVLVNVSLDEERYDGDNWYFVLSDEEGWEYQKEIQKIYGIEDLDYLKEKVNKLNKERKSKDGRVEKF